VISISYLLTYTGKDGLNGKTLENDVLKVVVI